MALMANANRKGPGQLSYLCSLSFTNIFYCLIPGWHCGGKGLLYIQQVGNEGIGRSSISALSFTFLLSFIFFLFSHLPDLPSLYSISMGNDIKWPTKVDISLNRNSNN